MLTKSMNQWFLPGKKILLAALLFFVSARAYSIIYWQAYPITAVIGTNGAQQRLECSVYDSLLGSWQYYNTPYFNSSIDTGGGCSTIIVFATYHPPSLYDLDSTFGFVTFDQELHQFMPVIQYHQDPDYPGGYVNAFDGAVSVFTECCFDVWDGSTFQDVEGYIYDIKNHSWSGGYLAYQEYAEVQIKKGGLFITKTDDASYAPVVILNYFDPAIHILGENNLGNICHYCSEGDQDLYYSFHDGMLWNQGADFSAYDPKLHLWKYWRNSYVNFNDYLVKDGIFYARHSTAGTRFFGIYDDSLHKWKLDSTHFAISNVLIKDRVVAYKYSNKVYYMAFSPTLRTWVKDSSTVTNGLDSLYIQNGTVKWRNTLGVTKKAGYNDATGWGNYNTPLLLNYHLTDFYSSTGEPLIFVRNYSIGTDSVMYDFGDGITTGWHQSSLYHLYKVNGHYKPGGVNYNICISTYNSTGLQSSCTAVTHPCSATFNNVTNSCPGACNGIIHAIPQTGQAPFTYHWSNGATTSTVNSLCTGGYAVTVTDNAGCSITESLQINAMQLDSAVVNTCTGSCSGEASVMATYGTFPFTYLWSTGDTTVTASNLCAGTFTVTVTDNKGCTKSTAVAVTNNANSIIAYQDIADPPCCSSCTNGWLEYEVHGTGPFSWSWTPNVSVVDTGTYSGVFYLDYQSLPPGIYELTITDGFGCSVVKTDTLVPALSDSVIVNGPTSLCAGGSVLLTANTGSGFTYQWIKDGVNIPGATSQSYLATAIGNYKVYMNDWSSNCNITSDSVSVTVLPVATITPQGSTTFCQGDSVVLTVPVQFNCIYQWKKGGVNIPGATAVSYTATTGGVYKVKVTNTVGGCSQTTNAGITVTVNSLPSATITATGPTTFCMGDTLVLTVPAWVNKTYQWKKGGTNISGATNSSYPATTGGSYKVTVTNTVTGCSKTTVTATVLTTNPQPSATITPQGPTTFCAGGSVLLKGNAGTGYTYQWKKGGNNITGATNKNYTATIAGVYKLKVTNSYGCPKLSSGVTVTVPCKESVKVREWESEWDVKVYPNPSSGDFIFETEHSSTEKISISVYDMVGKLLQSGEMNNSRFTIHDSQLTPGVYAAIITDGKNKKVLRLIKTK